LIFSLCAFLSKIAARISNSGGFKSRFKPRNITTSLRHNTIEDIKSFYQSADLLLVDDIHLIAGKEKSQEEFFLDIYRSQTNYTIKLTTAI
jgi:hypothetical protein